MKNNIWNVYFTNRAKKQLGRVGIYIESISKIIRTIENDPYSPSFEKLQGRNDLYSRRINDQHNNGQGWLIFYFSRQLCPLQ